MHPRSLLLVLPLSVLAACGGDGATDTPDAAAPPDTAVADPCDYHEAGEATNDSSAEATGLTVDADGVAVCGVYTARTPGNFDTIDADTYAFSLPSPGTYLIQVDAPGAGALDVMLAFSFDDFTHVATAVGDRAVYVAELPAGPVRIQTAVRNATQPDAAIPYTLTVIPDDFDARVPAATGPADYTEAGDGADNSGNDSVIVHYINAFTVAQTAAADAPEPTGLTVGTGCVRIDGQQGPSANAYNDEYADRDTYLVTTGADVHVLAYRVEWADDASSAADDATFDSYLFAVPSGATMSMPIAAAQHLAPRLAGPSYALNAVAPSTPYWLWVGNVKGGALGHDKPYAITVCGAAAP